MTLKTITMLTSLLFFLVCSANIYAGRPLREAVQQKAYTAKQYKRVCVITEKIPKIELLLMANTYKCSCDNKKCVGKSRKLKKQLLKNNQRLAKLSKQPLSAWEIKYIKDIPECYTKEQVKDEQSREQLKASANLQKHRLSNMPSTKEVKKVCKYMARASTCDCRNKKCVKRNLKFIRKRLKQPNMPACKQEFNYHRREEGLYYQHR